MPIHINCDYCGKRIDVQAFVKDRKEGFKYLKLLNAAFAQAPTACLETLTELDLFPNGVFCSETCYHTLKECFAVWEKEKAE